MDCVYVPKIVLHIKVVEALSTFCWRSADRQTAAPTTMGRSLLEMWRKTATKKKIVICIVRTKIRVTFDQLLVKIPRRILSTMHRYEIFAREKKTVEYYMEAFLSWLRNAILSLNQQLW